MGKGSNSTVTNVQQLPPALAGALQDAYTDFNPFQKAFDAVGAFNPTASLTGTAGLSSGETAAINRANSLLSNQPAFLGAAQQNLGGLMEPSGTNARLEAQIDDALADVVNNVSSQYALGGRLGSDSFADSLGEGISSGIAPILAQNLQDDKRTQLAAISAAPGLLGADQALISQAAQLGGLARGIDQARKDAIAAVANQQNILDQNRINALLSAAGMGGGLFGQTSTQTGGGPSALSSGLGGAITGATLGNAIGPALAGSGLGSALGVTAANAGGLGAALGAGLSLFSDKRLKKDIKQIGTHANGLAMYSWQWNDEAQSRGFDIYPTEGFMAQEAREVYPQHVHVHPSGYLMLDYASLSNEAMGAA